jgi:hypothetical protein
MGDRAVNGVTSLVVPENSSGGRESKIGAWPTQPGHGELLITPPRPARIGRDSVPAIGIDGDQLRSEPAQAPVFRQELIIRHPQHPSWGFFASPSVNSSQEGLKPDRAVGSQSDDPGERPLCPFPQDFGRLSKETGGQEPLLNYNRSTVLITGFGRPRPALKLVLLEIITMALFTPRFVSTSLGNHLA